MKFMLLQAFIDGQGSIWPFALFCCAGVIGVMLWAYFSRVKVEIGSRCFRLDGTHISANELFKSIKGRVSERKLPITISEESMFENGVASSLREFLHISYLDRAIDVSAGFFGDSTYISWHIMGKKPSRFATRFPAFAYIFGATSEHTTYFRADTKSTFQGIILDCIQEELNAFGEQNGIRAIQDDGGHGIRKPKGQEV